MVNSSAGVGEGVGVCAPNQPVRDKTPTAIKRENLFNMPQEYAQ
jgi:hypothetical protein